MIFEIRNLIIGLHRDKKPIKTRKPKKNCSQESDGRTSTSIQGIFNFKLPMFIFIYQSGLILDGDRISK